MDSSKRKRSISHELTVSLLITTAIFTIATMGGAFWVIKSIDKRHHEKEILDYFQFLSKNLALPLWNYDIDVVKKIGEVSVLNERIIQIDITNEEGAALYHSERTSDEKPIVRSQDIVYKGDVVGHITVGFQPNLGKKYYHELLLGTLGLVMTLSVLALITGYFLRKMLKAPIDTMAKGMDAVAKGDYAPPEYLYDYTEFREILYKFEQMADSITQRESELANINLELNSIIDSMPSMLICVDRRGRVTRWNSEAEKVMGILRENAAGRDLAEVIPRMAPEMERVYKSMAVGEVQIDLRRPNMENGQLHYEDVTAYPLQGNVGEGAVIRVDDVTEQVRIEEMMVQSEKMLSVGGLAAGMAHEINNPLAGLMQTANVMSIRLNDSRLPANRIAAEKAGTTMEAIHAFMEARGITRMLDNIREAGSRAAEIVSNMLSFARKGESTMSTHDLAALMDRTIALAGTDFDLKKKYDFRQIEIVRDYEENMPPIPCDSGNIQQVLLNILRNGAEAMQENRMRAASISPRFTLRLAYEPLEDMAVIEIADNGPGMDEETCKRVFEPFFTEKAVGKGTGLGLSISYFIVTENHNGQMIVESIPGKGSKFIVKLPVNRKTG